MTQIYPKKQLFRTHTKIEIMPFHASILFRSRQGYQVRRTIDRSVHRWRRSKLETVEVGHGRATMLDLLFYRCSKTSPSFSWRSLPCPRPASVRRHSCRDPPRSSPYHRRYKSRVSHTPLAQQWLHLCTAPVEFLPSLQPFVANVLFLF